MSALPGKLRQALETTATTPAILLELRWLWPIEFYRNLRTQGDRQQEPNGGAWVLVAHLPR